MAYILGIDTSCDDTSIAVLDENLNILSNIVSSQYKLHQEYGGVVPELASRRHVDNINIVFDRVLKESKLNVSDISAIAVTNRPGLIGSLLIGVSFAKTLSFLLDKPLIDINHLYAHIYANFVNRKNELKFPFIALVISGGHTNLYIVKDHFDIKLAGYTLDDAAGEALDKIGRFFSLPYPAGPHIEKIAKEGDELLIKFPIAKTKHKYAFSFSGLKTSVITYVKKHKVYKLEDVLASFQYAIFKAVVEKTIKLAKATNIKRIVVSGGVSANNRLKLMFQENLPEDFSLLFPQKGLSTDNAAMVAARGYFKFLNNKFASLDLDAYFS